jgi:hypothetical protein
MEKREMPRKRFFTSVQPRAAKSVYHFSRITTAARTAAHKVKIHVALRKHETMNVNPPLSESCIAPLSRHLYQMPFLYLFI